MSSTISNPGVYAVLTTFPHASTVGWEDKYRFGISLFKQAGWLAGRRRPAGGTPAAGRRDGERSAGRQDRTLWL